MENGKWKMALGMVQIWRGAGGLIQLHHAAGVVYIENILFRCIYMPYSVHLV